MTALVWRCDICSEPVADGRGYVTVDYADLRAYARAVAEWEREHEREDGWNVHTLSELLRYPACVAWKVLHSACDPNPDSCDYWIEVSRCRTAGALLHWTSHLMQKRWLGSTNWRDLINMQAAVLEGRRAA